MRLSSRAAKAKRSASLTYLRPCAARWQNKARHCGGLNERAAKDQDRPPGVKRTRDERPASRGAGPPGRRRVGGWRRMRTKVRIARERQRECAVYGDRRRPGAADSEKAGIKRIHRGGTEKRRRTDQKAVNGLRVHSFEKREN